MIICKVINDSAKEFSTMLRNRMIKLALEVCTHKKSTLNCSYKQERDKSSNLEVLHNFDNGIALEDKLQFCKSYCMLRSSNEEFELSIGLGRVSPLNQVAQRMLEKPEFQVCCS